MNAWRYVRTCRARRTSFPGRQGTGFDHDAGTGQIPPGAAPAAPGDGPQLPRVKSRRWHAGPGPVREAAAPRSPSQGPPSTDSASLHRGRDPGSDSPFRPHPAVNAKPYRSRQVPNPGRHRSSEPGQAPAVPPCRQGVPHNLRRTGLSAHMVHRVADVQDSGGRHDAGTGLEPHQAVDGCGVSDRAAGIRAKGPGNASHGDCDAGSNAGAACVPLRIPRVA